MPVADVECTLYCRYGYIDVLRYAWGSLMINQFTANGRENQPIYFEVRSIVYLTVWPIMQVLCIALCARAHHCSHVFASECVCVDK